MTGHISPIRVFVAGTSWRLFGSRRAGQILLNAMASDDEQNRMLAGMSLVKAGRRSFELIEKKLQTGEVSAPIIRLLPDIGGPEARVALDKIAGGAPGEMSDTARQCIELMNRMDTLEQDGA